MGERIFQGRKSLQSFLYQLNIENVFLEVVYPLPKFINPVGFSIFIEVGFLFYASLILYKGLQMPEIFNGKYFHSKYEKSPLTELDKKRYLKKIETVMQDKKPYLNPNLTLMIFKSINFIPFDILIKIIFGYNI